MKLLLNSRRSILKAFSAIVPVALFGDTVIAQDRLTEEDQMAKMLLYVHDAGDVDISNPMAARFKPGQNCANCMLFQTSEDPEWGPCSIFQYKLVNANGWCSAWVLKSYSPLLICCLYCFPWVQRHNLYSLPSFDHV